MIPSLILTLVTTFLCISIISLIYFRGTLFFLAKTHYITSLGTLSYDFSKSMKTILKSSQAFPYFSIKRLCKIYIYIYIYIYLMVYHPGIKPNRFSDIVDSRLNLCLITLSLSFIVWLINLIS